MKPNDTVPSISELPVVVVAKGYMKHELELSRWLKFLKSNKKAIPESSKYGTL